jgi:shikimate dehydrogenase
MHNAAYEALHLAARYTVFAVPDAEKALQRMRETGIEGASVTIPLKTAIMAGLDEIDDHSRAIGAVNTLWTKAGRIFGAASTMVILMSSSGWMRSRPNETNSRVVLCNSAASSTPVAPAPMMAMCN